MIKVDEALGQVPADADGHDVEDQERGHWNQERLGPLENVQGSERTKARDATRSYVCRHLSLSHQSWAQGLTTFLSPICSSLLSNDLGKSRGSFYFLHCVAGQLVIANGIWCEDLGRLAW